MKQLFFLFMIFIAYHAKAQVAITADGSNPDANAMLDVKSTNKGVKFPRLTTGSATWEGTAKLIPPHSNFFPGTQSFGSALLWRDHKLLVGAANENGPAYSTGAVYVYDLADGSWFPTVDYYLTDPDAYLKNDFGYTLDFDGAHFIIGSYGGSKISFGDFNQ